MSADPHYEVREHMVAGVEAVWWCEPGKADTLVFTTGQSLERLTLLHSALGTWIREHRPAAKAPAPREPVPVLHPAEVIHRNHQLDQEGHPTR